MAAPMQSQLPQNCVDSEDSSPLQYILVGDLVLQPQLQYPSWAPEVESIESSRLLLVDGPGFCSIQQRRQDDCPEHLQFGVEVETMTVAEGVLQMAERSTGFGDSASHFIFHFFITGERAAQVDEVVHE
ncbi:hypothetical protein SprV_0501934100 [Sparganum proliferum]